LFHQRPPLTNLEVSGSRYFGISRYEAQVGHVGINDYVGEVTLSIVLKRSETWFWGMIAQYQMKI
jgi:hypothetical protein